MHSFCADGGFTLTNITSTLLYVRIFNSLLRFFVLPQGIPTIHRNKKVVHISYRHSVYVSGYVDSSIFLNVLKCCFVAKFSQNLHLAISS